MPKKATDTPAPTAPAPDLATPQGVFNHLVTLARKSSAPDEDPTIKALAKSNPQLLTAVAPLLCSALRFPGPGDDRHDRFGSTRTDALQCALRAVVRLKLPFDLATATPIFDHLLLKPQIDPWTDPLLLTVGLAERLVADHGLKKLPRDVERCLLKIRDTIDGPRAQRNERKAVERINALLGQGPRLPVNPGDPVGDAIVADLNALTGAERDGWVGLLNHCHNSVGNTPPKKWLASLDLLLPPVADDLPARCAKWFPALSSARADGKPARIDPANYETLKGLTWAVAVLAERGRHRDDRLAAALQQLAVAGYTKVPGMGRRCPKVGDAAVAALSHFPLDVAAARLSAVHRSARDPMSAETLTAALDALATKAGIPRDQLEELTIPTFGLADDGTRRTPLGPVTAVLDIASGAAEVTYLSDKGKPIKSPPAAVKRDHADALAALKQDVKDLDKLIASQRDRLDALLAAPRTWPLADFRRLYLDHPLVSRAARRLIWTVGGTPALVHANRFEDVAGKPIKTSPTTPVAPWHPLNAKAKDVLAWRRRLETLEITQPFKQAHREIYLLTDAERTTATYSNRFAAHLIRQHVFRALATGRGWEVPYLGNWDNAGQAPTRRLPAHNLRIEFWVEPADVADDEGSLPGGGVPYLSTDQVRFYRLDPESREPLPLDQIAPLAFSEAMRDVDLFVAVCSVGADPTWADAGQRTAAQRNYWNSYSFGDLSASAQTRRDVLATLLPKLKIADRCTLADRFLEVRGNLQTYKIHLGSGNILIAPNDRYLCIVPQRRADEGPLYLPFEGDPTLSVILSKALLLAADDQITDPTIVRQIREA